MICRPETNPITQVGFSAQTGRSSAPPRRDVGAAAARIPGAPAPVPAEFHARGDTLTAPSAASLRKIASFLRARNMRDFTVFSGIPTMLAASFTDFS